MKKVLLVVALGALVFSMSGCFVMRTMTFNKSKVRAGGVFSALITVAGDSSGDPEYPFFLVAGELGSLPANGSKLDLKGKSGGPVAMKHTADGDAIAPFASDACPSTGPKRGVLTGDNIVVTKNPFASNKSNLKAKLTIRLTSDAMGGDGFGVWMGTWTDDGDGTPEDPSSTDDTYDCQPPYTSFILQKGGGGPKF